MTMQAQNIEHPNSTSEKRSLRRIVFPVKLGIEPMERLLIANFTGDTEYEALESQMFDDHINGKGLRILRYRKDNKVDVYWQPGVRVDRTTFSLGEGIGDFAETNIEPARFEIDDHGVDIHFAFTDTQGRKVELLIRENTVENIRIPFLAPVGNDIKKPKQLFFAYMHSFDFIRRKGTKISAQIGDRMLRPATFPILRNFQRVMFMRYSVQPIVGTINPPMTTPVVVELAIPGSIEVAGMRLIVDEGGKISLITAEQKHSKVEVEFLPGFPNLFDLLPDATEKGRWTFRISEAIITGGTYRLSRKDSLVNFELDVTEKWKPAGLPLSLDIFTRVMRFFRTWPTTYRWRGTVDLGKLIMSGAWERKSNR